MGRVKAGLKCQDLAEENVSPARSAALTYVSPSLIKTQAEFLISLVRAHSPSLCLRPPVPAVFSDGAQRPNYGNFQTHCSPLKC